MFDAVVVAAGFVATVAGLVYFPTLAVLTPFTLGHFLLFCNTFRIGGERSLIWIGALVVNVGWWALARPSELPWTAIVLTQLPVTAILIIQTVLGRNYHGVACEWINPERYRSGALSEGAFTSRVLRWCRVPPRAIEVLTGRKVVGEPDAAGKSVDSSKRFRE